MEALDPLLHAAALPARAARLEAAARAHEAELGQQLRLGVRRRLLSDDLEIVWGGERLGSLWLVSHQALRRAGFRQHPEARAVVLAWQGRGLVLLRPEGERRSLTLRPASAPADAGSTDHVVVPAGTPYDTLADASPWHLLVFHSCRAAQLRTLEPTESGWTELSEEIQNP
jgi:hypothetical protein